MRRVLRGLLSALPVCAALAGAGSAARAEQATDAALKAAYIYHFLNLTRWPDNSGPLVVGVVGDSEVGRQLQSALPRRVGAREVLVVPIRLEDPSPRPCHALYIPAAHHQGIPDLLGRFAQLPTLTISDAAGFIERGGMIGFVVVGDKLRFDVNQRVSLGKGVQYSAKLLELARSIQR